MGVQRIRFLFREDDWNLFLKKIYHHIELSRKSVNNLIATALKKAANRIGKKVRPVIKW
ncbi:hypothetical protein ABIB40_003151 [Pedobacter sp. UYP30]|uniref:hypothetical protein n=1 Tax=Pedobacter sp. UYP30 TaxID=1756400 RepID=UPI0033966C53